MPTPRRGEGMPPNPKRRANRNSCGRMLFGANREPRQHVLRNRHNPSLRGNPHSRVRGGGPAGRANPNEGNHAAGPGIPDWVTERRPKDAHTPTGC